MRINFFELLQQSWNFMRNQRTFSLVAVGSLVALQLALLFLTPREAAVISVEQMEQQQVDFAQMISALMPTILISIINLFINLLIILNIQAINNGQYQSFFNPTPEALKAFFPTLVLTIFMVLPLSLGVSFAVASGVSILALPIIIMGFYLFIKLSLSIYVYLLEKPQKSVTETLKFTMQLSRGKMMPLVLFTIIASLIPNILSNLLVVLGNDLISLVVKSLISSVITVFIAIFSFRFYQVYRQLPANN